MDFKIDMFLEFGKLGCTETLYAQAANFNNAMTLADDLAAHRAKLFPALVKMLAVRVSDVNFKRDSKVLASDKWGGKTFKTEECDHAFATHYIRLNSENKYWRAMHLSGIPDNLHEGILVDSPLRPAWDKAVKEYTDYLIATPFYIRAIDRDTVGIPKQVQSIGQPDAEGLVEIGVTAHGYANQDKVRISGATGGEMHNINGIKTIFAVQANSFKVHSTDHNAVLNYTGNGFASVRKHLLKPITDAVPLALRSRQRGHGNFLQQQGSRRRKK